MIEFLGYIGALIIGIVLGITGGGGSILTVPILVYLLGLHPITATAYSLFIVGTTSAFGTIQNFKKDLVAPKTALQFAIPSVIGVYLTRKFIVPAIPDPLFYFASLQLSKGTFLMLLFAMVMLLAAISMLKETKEPLVNTPKNKYLVIFQLFLVGILIGLIGAGGGFLIIPALMTLAQLTIRKAIGTSLLIITINSLIGFLGDVQTITIDWSFLLGFTSLSVIGIFIGLFAQKYLNEKLLKKIFSYFVFVMSILILYRELFS
ncbi:sulfite exporter TauE/SafE family protein [Flavobacterium sp. IMCC34852]|uniref:Probable membrane transporter protein n=1 Tax=Flavobacterium rivulicola TaxID=2732161 RepID=A0A7Y3RB19_9FLAO|nr:sulfite exporter TauE/SafE family protein [Flavobacterium sp. IMCC34852]NNT72726.1 sulfite exporter TauE/SafE family protein [Flavobacterium sp. IMCC34852]